MKKFCLAFLIFGALVTAGCDYSSFWCKKDADKSVDAEGKTVCCGGHGDDTSVADSASTDVVDAKASDVVAA